MTNFAHHSFATRVLRANATPTALVVATFVLASLLILATPLASAQTFIFNRADFVTGTGPSVVAVGDFNGDGHMDVVTGNDDTANTVSVLLGKGDGTFAPHVDYAAGGGVTGVAVGDFNGDGKLDIVVLYGYDPAKVAVLLGNGDGTFKPFIPTTAGFQGGSIAVADFNGDGKLDVAVSDNASAIPGVDIMLGNGDGTFKAPVSYATGADPRMVIAGDFNSDGKLDLATANAESETISVLLGNGDGTFQTHKDNSTSIAASCISLAAGALSDNRRLDIVAGCQAEGEVVVLISNGNGTFKAAKAYPVPAGVDDVALGDFNGDGKLDVAVTNSGTDDMVSILPGSGSGTLKAAVAFGTNFGPSGIAAADFNGDGKIDIVTADDGGPFGVTIATISVLLSNGKDMFAARTDYSVGDENVTGAYSGIAAADLTGNGKPDLIVPITYAFPYEISILMNKGNGTFKPFVSYPLPTGPIAVVTGDFNNDHKADIAVANGNGTGSITVLLNSGTGTFPTYAEYSTNGISYGLAVGDFNKDGNLDIVAANESQNTVSVLLGNGTGAFPTFATYTTGSFPLGVAVGDFNGDGWPDIAVADSRGGTVSILINKADGSGTFLPKVDYAAAGGGAPSALAVGSFRGNGIIDLAVATNSAFGGIEVLLGKGDGTFQPAVPYDTLNNANAVAVGDFNNDGNLDLAVSIANAGSTFGFVTILPGLGNGTFGPGVTLTSAPLPSGIVAADFNGDGGLDLATANGTTGGDTGSATVLLNEPVIGLTPTSLTFGAQKVGTASAAQVITLDNPGATPLKITSITISGDYAETNDCPAKLTIGKSCTINVTFSPTQTGTRTGTLSIKDSALSSVQKIALTGSGT
jgi:hypothetical protein